jgi:hypothetical protein
MAGGWLAEPPAAESAQYDCTHLGRIPAETGMRRQAELVALLMRGVAGGR